MLLHMRDSGGWLAGEVPEVPSAPTLRRLERRGYVTCEYFAIGGRAGIVAASLTKLGVLAARWMHPVTLIVRGYDINAAIGSFAQAKHREK